MSPRYCSPSTRMSMPISSWNRIHSRVDHSEDERLRRSVFREDGPRRGPLDQIEAEDLGGHLLEILVDPCDVPEEGEEGQGRLRLVPPDAIEALGDKAQVLRMLRQNRLVNLDLGCAGLHERTDLFSDRRGEGPRERLLVPVVFVQ